MQPSYFDKLHKWLLIILVVAVGVVLIKPIEAGAATFETPALLTSIGQSTDIAMVDVVLNTRERLAIPVKDVATDADLSGIRTLIVVLGASSKGLGAAGTDSNAEMARARALLEAAKAKGVKIVAMHVGGEARRGRLSDPFVELGAEYADLMVAVAAGNGDGFLTRLSQENGYELVEVSRITDVGAAIGALF